MGFEFSYRDKCGIRHWSLAWPREVVRYGILSYEVTLDNVGIERYFPSVDGAWTCINILKRTDPFYVDILTEMFPDKGDLND